MVALPDNDQSSANRPLIGALVALVALEAIEARIHALCSDLDAGDESAARAAFSSGALCMHGPFRGLAHDYVAAVIARRLPQLSPHGWHLTSHRAHTDGATAWAETYAIASAGEDLMCGLRLLDLLEHNGREWLIARRETLLDWTFVWTHPGEAIQSEPSGEEN